MNLFAGYKVGRVDQAETALGAEMRVAADKTKGKSSEEKTKEKIVRRYVFSSYTSRRILMKFIQGT